MSIFDHIVEASRKFESLEGLDDIINIQKREPSNATDKYMQGLTNGLLVAKAVVTGSQEEVKLIGGNGVMDENKIIDYIKKLDYSMQYENSNKWYDIITLVSKRFQISKIEAENIINDEYLGKLEEAVNELNNHRLGRCYELSGQWVMDHNDYTLVHGSVFNPKYNIKPNPHAWTEKTKQVGPYPFEVVYDPVMDKELPKDYYYHIMGAKSDIKYTYDEMMSEMRRTMVWGPWKGMPNKRGSRPAKVTQFKQSDIVKPEYITKECIVRILKEKYLKELATEHVPALKELLGMQYSDFTRHLDTLMKYPEFQDLLRGGKQDGVAYDDVLKYREVFIPVKDLSPTQSEIAADKSLADPKWGPLSNTGTAKKYLAGGDVVVGAPIVTGGGRFIIDGHHRWSQLFLMNPNARISAIDFPGLSTAEDGLKKAQLIIAATVTNPNAGLPSSSGKGMNLLTTSADEVKAYVLANLKPEVLPIFTNAGFDTPEAIATYISTNAMALPKPQGPAPDRSEMPQTDAVGDFNSAAKSGAVNVEEPLVKGDNASIFKKSMEEKLVKRNFNIQNSNIKSLEEN